MYALSKVSKSNQIVVPAEFRKLYDIKAGDKISWTNTEEGMLLKVEKKYTEEDIIGLIKKELPINSVEIKKRGSKGLKW
ncbi:AbrB/MazE/SpoVT family DNA-binding domain-containing protein [uncultured Methanobrevibacter sp.]|uniref:AbrB/MazE/SpoVT family DNA-binding domain-containing protein n=1 Tax=uncultured Methanobrevibacter sp. TaxID=253161 RepID=UPI0025DD8202|nr:AbrB/MazE/SpoVT family DNA-binding domain-containing protein [uncultured Methanobrevibacter sp.]